MSDKLLVGGALPIPRPGADGSYGKGEYFQYINVPANKVFEWGYRRGNDPNHFREEYLSQKDHAFKAKVRPPLRLVNCCGSQRFELSLPRNYLYVRIIST